MIRPPLPRASIAPPISRVHTNVLVRFEIEYFLPLIQRQLRRRNVDPPPAHVVDQNVDRTMFFQHLPADALTLLGLPHVGRNRKGLATDLSNFLGRFVERHRIACHEDDVGAGFGNRERHGAPQPTAAARDQ